MSRLIIFVSNYPYGYGEPFFDDELKQLSKKFESILIVRKSTENLNPVFQINLLDNVEFYELPKLKKIGLLKLIEVFIYLLKTIWIEISRLKSLKHIKFYLSHVYSAIKYKEVIKNNIEIKKSDILYSYWLDDLTLGLLFLKIESRQPHLVISRCHSWDVYEYRHKINYLPLRKFLYRNLDFLATISEDAISYIKRSYVSRDEFNIECCSLGVEDFKLESNLLCCKIENQFSVLTFSTFSKVKNIELFVESIDLIESMSINWYHIGDGLFKSEYEKEIYDLIYTRFNFKSNVRVNLLGFLDQKEIATFLNTTWIDLMVNTSYYEGIPVTIMQAMSFEIPVLAPNVGGISEIVNSKNGFLLSSKPDKFEISESIKQFSKWNNEEVKKMRDESRNTFLTRYSSSVNYLKFSNKLHSMINKEFKQCVKCLYDSKVYPSIRIDKNGICDVCLNYDELSKRKVVEENEGLLLLNNILQEVKTSGKDKLYDCVLGVSGGVDSSFLMIKMKEWGLKPLIIHVDNGWNSELAVANIEKLVNTLGFDLYTHVLDWNEMRDLQLAFFKSSVIDIDLPFDNACWKKMFELVVKHKIKYIFSGHNTVTEGWMPDSFVHYKLDKINIHNIHKLFGKIKLKKISFLGPIDLFYFQKIKRIKFITPLDYIKYDKKEVLNLLETKYSWRPYGNKHYENIFTRFYQGYILPKKFNIDKRISHLSTLICSGQISKEEAILEINKEIYEAKILEQDKAFFIKKMNLSESEFEQIMKMPTRLHTDFRSYLNLYRKLGKFKKIIKLFVRKNEL